MAHPIFWAQYRSLNGFNEHADMVLLKLQHTVHSIRTSKSHTDCFAPYMKTGSTFKMGIQVFGLIVPFD